MKNPGRIVAVLLCIYVLGALLKNLLDVRLVADLWVLFVLVAFGGTSVIHSLTWYGTKNTLVFFGITFVVAWSLESLSILTTFPFGKYYYTDLLLWKLGDVPVLIMPAYYSVGYLSWVMSHVLSHRISGKYTRWDFVVIPGIAAFIMVIWDLTFDPLSSTITGLWVWQEGGSYFGVPLQNYVGWFLCVYLIFSFFFFYIRRSARPDNPQFRTKGFWVYPTLAYMVYSADTLTKPFRALFGFDENLPVPAHFFGGVRWMTYDIYSALALVSMFTMILVGLITLLSISRNPGLQYAND